MAVIHSSKITLCVLSVLAVWITALALREAPPPYVKDLKTAASEMYTGAESYIMHAGVFSPNNNNNQQQQQQQEQQEQAQEVQTQLPKQAHADGTLDGASHELDNVYTEANWRAETGGGPPAFADEYLGYVNKMAAKKKQAEAMKKAAALMKQAEEQKQAAQAQAQAQADKGAHHDDDEAKVKKAKGHELKPLDEDWLLAELGGSADYVVDPFAVKPHHDASKAAAPQHVPAKASADLRGTKGE